MKILCLGNNTEHTDQRTRELAVTHSQFCHGLLSELDGALEPHSYQDLGFYHSTVYDVEFGRLLDLCQHFDQVWMLDQPRCEWSHPDSFLLTVKVIQQLGSRGLFLDPTYRSSADYFGNLVKDNKSFCIFPFIELLVNDQHTTVCCRSSTPISLIHNLDFAQDANYQAIRSKMLNGQLVPEHCSTCYKIESQGLPSARTQETVEWANRLGLQHVDDLAGITKPFYYEVRASNKCNLQCRMCSPASSHLIAAEYQRIGIEKTNASTAVKHTAGFEIVDLDHLAKLYVAGGEPMIMPELYQFLDKCIEQKRTDFELVINTNGTKLSDKFKQQLTHFENLHFIFSIDGYQDINHYIRWPSSWDDIVQNWKFLYNHGRKVTVNTTVSIYNIANLHRLYQYIDHYFPKTLVHCQIVDEPAHLSPWLYPDPEAAVKSLTQVLDSACGRNDQLFNSSIRGYIDILNNISSIDSAGLREFYSFNDKLDASRKIALGDYIPELEHYRNRCSF